METPKEQQEITKNTNGSFLSGIEAKASETSPLAGSVQRVVERYFGEGELEFALKLIKSQHIRTLTDYWRNSALGVLVSGQAINDFDDTTFDETRQGEKRTIESYTHVYNPIDGDDGDNADKRFMGRRLNGFDIPEDKEPVMAIVALDPKLISPEIDESKKQELLKEIKILRQTIMNKDEADGEFSLDLIDVLSSCLLANDTFVSSKKEDGAEIAWALSFDKIACLKALYLLLSGDKEHSGLFRQGAVRIVDEKGNEVIVAGSAQNSAIDEAAARIFAQAVLTIPDSN